MAKSYKPKIGKREIDRRSSQLRLGKVCKHPLLSVWRWFCKGDLLLLVVRLLKNSFPFSALRYSVP